MPLQAIRQPPADAKHYDLIDSRKHPVRIFGRPVAGGQKLPCISEGYGRLRPHDWGLLDALNDSKRKAEIHDYFPSA